MEDPDFLANTLKEIAIGGGIGVAVGLALFVYVAGLLRHVLSQWSLKDPDDRILSVILGLGPASPLEPDTVGALFRSTFLSGFSSRQQRELIITLSGTGFHT